MGVLPVPPTDKFPTEIIGILNLELAIMFLSYRKLRNTWTM